MSEKNINFARRNGLSYAETATHNKEPSMTRQEFAEECDINTLMKKFDSAVGQGPGGLPNQRDPAAMFYADFTGMPGSLLEYQQYMFDAEKAFMSLPAVVRKEFANDPYQFAEFAGDPENIGQLRTWGLAAPEAAEPAPIKVQVIPEAAPELPASPEPKK